MIRLWMKMLNNKFISWIIFLELVGRKQIFFKDGISLWISHYEKSMINFKRFDDLVLSGNKMKMIWPICFFNFVYSSKMNQILSWCSPTLLKSLSPPNRNWFSSGFALLVFYLYHGLKRPLSCYKKVAIVITSDNRNGDWILLGNE